MTRNAPAAPPLSDELLDAFEAAIGYTFRDRELLRLCLTHSSAARTRAECNERLEFLGDAILGAVICRELYHRFPGEPEGELTRIKSDVVSRSTCARITVQFELDGFLLLGKGIAANGRPPSSVLAAVYEAVVGGVFVDGGWEAAADFVTRTMHDEIDGVAGLRTGINYKSLLQQQAQREFGATPVYTVLDEKGPDHLKCFKVSALVGSRVFPAAWGPSKKEAEQRAAENALAHLGGLDTPHAAE